MDLAPKCCSMMIFIFLLQMLDICFHVYLMQLKINCWKSSIPLNGVFLVKFEMDLVSRPTIEVMDFIQFSRHDGCSGVFELCINVRLM